MTAPPWPVLWIDPGKMTGLALWSPGGISSPEHTFWCDEFDFMTAGDHVEAICIYHATGLRVGWEHFHVHARTPGDDAHHAIEMIGVVRRIACRARVITLKPAPPGSRDIATREMLEHIGWWVTAKDDAQSAAQHMLAWMLRSDQVPSEIDVKLAQFREKMNGDIG